jgi:hypothetical protein
MCRYLCCPAELLLTSLGDFRRRQHSSFPSVTSSIFILSASSQCSIVQEIFITRNIRLGYCKNAEEKRNPREEVSNSGQCSKCYDKRSAFTGTCIQTSKKSYASDFFACSQTHHWPVFFSSLR